MLDEKRIDRPRPGGTARALRLLGGVALAALGLALATDPAPAAAATLRVEPTGNDGGDCTTVPCATIQHAVDVAGDGDTIAVGAGTYAENVTVEKEVALRGANAGVAAGGARGAETTITAAAGQVLAVRGPGVSVAGFTIAGAGTYTLYAADTTGLRVADNVIRGDGRALTLTLGSEAAAIEGNLIEGGLYGLVAGGAGVYADLRVADNSIFAAPTSNYAMFNAGEGTFPGLQVVDNRFRGPSNIGGNVEGGLVSGNSFDNESSDPALQVSLHGSAVSANSFEGHGAGACFQLFGSQYGLDPSNGATIAGNRFHGCAPYAIQLSPGIDNVAITGNTITDSYDGINTRLLAGEAPWNLGAAIRIAGNRIVGSTHLGIENGVAGTLDAADNWWGCNAGPALAAGNGCDAVSAGVRTAPWLVLTLAAPAAVRSGRSATVTAAIDTDSSGARVAGVPDGTPVTFSTDRGSLTPAASATVGGLATSVLVSRTAGIADVAATVDRQAVSTRVRIEGPPPPRPHRPPHRTGSPPAKPAPPRIHLPGGGSPLRVSASGRVTVASITCPRGSCLIAIRQRKVKFGKRGFPLRLRRDRLIGEGESTRVTAILPRAARRMLRARGRGRAIVRLRLFSGAGVQELPINVRVRASRRSPRDRTRTQARHRTGRAPSRNAAR